MNAQLKIVQIALDKIRPYKRNAKKHPKEQIEKIAKAIEAAGWDQPIVLDAKNVIIKGHGRFQAAQLLGLKHAPCIVRKDLSPAIVKAARLADNRVAESSWDYSILSEELQSLSAELFTGFSEIDLQEINESLLKKPEKKLTKDQRKNFESAAIALARKNVGLIDLHLKAFKEISENVTRERAVFLFLKALYLGEDYPRYANTDFFPEWVNTSGNIHTYLELLRKIDEKSVKNFLFAFPKMRVQDIITGSVPILSARSALDFPALIARDAINKYARNGKVLDPCNGWGGRFVGFLLSSAKEYTGYDPATFAGVRDIGIAFRKYIPEKKFQFSDECFEDSREKKSFHDFAITSPPYYDVEKYQGGNQSRTRYKTYEEWRQKFYAVLIQKVYRQLKPGARFFLNVGSQTYPLIEDAKTIATACGFKLESEQNQMLAANMTETPAEKSETVLLFKKTKR